MEKTVSTPYNIFPNSYSTDSGFVEQCNMALFKQFTKLHFYIMKGRRDCKCIYSLIINILCVHPAVILG